jgi:hypothetical protein
MRTNDKMNGFMKMESYSKNKMDLLKLSLRRGFLKMGMVKCALFLMLISLSLTSGCAHKLEGEIVQKEDPALMALSEASVEVNRRRFRKLANGESPNLHINPESDLFKPFKMDQAWSGKGSLAVITLATAIGWEAVVEGGSGNGIITIEAIERNMSIFELLYRINRELERYREEIEADEILQRLCLKRIPR